MEPVILRTPRLVLSTPRAADVDAIHLACQDADIQRYTTLPSPYLREHAESFVSHAAVLWGEGTAATWAIRLEDGLVGVIGLSGIGGGNAALGYWMSRSHRRRGLLTEAAREVIDWAFAPEELGTARIEWRAMAGNLASARAARTLGFQYEGTLRRALPNSLGRKDGWLAALLSSDERTAHPWPVLPD